jgi:hypothetical protein
MGTLGRDHSGHFHAVRFYKDAESLAEIVCRFIADGLQQGEPAVLIATAEHLQCFRDCFSSTGIDVDAAIADRRLTVLDAEDTLQRFMRDDVPMPDRFTETLASVLASVAVHHPDVTIRAYGEMVDILWKRGQTAAAIRVEMLWNNLARSHDFGLLCGYAMGNFYKGTSTEDICALHSHVTTDTGSHVALG